MRELSVAGVSTWLGSGALTGAAIVAFRTAKGRFLAGRKAMLIALFSAALGGFFLLPCGCTAADFAPPSAEEPASPAGPAAEPGRASADDWPLFRADRRASGVAEGDLPDKLAVLWTFLLDEGWFESTAAIVDGVVYVGSTNGNLYAITLADGKKKWAFSTEPGFTASPAVRDGRVYIGDSYGTFYCVDAQTGKQKWSFETDAETNSSANFHGEHVLFGSQDSFLYCLEADTGRVVWKYESGDQIRCFPTVVEDRGFVAGCDGRLHVVDLAEGKLAAEVDLEGPTGSTPAVLGPRVFVGTEGCVFFGIDWKKAEVVWTFDTPERRLPFRSSAAVTEEAVLVGSRDKRLYALDPKTGRKLWAAATRGQIDSSPVIVGQRVFFGSDDGNLYAVDRKTGKEVWRYELGGSIIASPAVAAGRLVIGTDDGELVCFGNGE